MRVQNGSCAGMDNIFDYIGLGAYLKQMENVVRPLLLIINILFIGLSGCEEPNRIKHLIDYSAKDSSGVECGDFGMFSEKAVEIDGPITNAKAGVVGGMTTDSQGNLYFTDYGYHTIRVLKTNGEVVKLAGLSGDYGCNDGKNHEAHLFNPWGIAIDNKGVVYFTDHYMVRKVDLDGSITTIAGVSNKMGFIDGKGKEAGFWNYQLAMAMGHDGNLYLGDQGAIRQVTPEGVVTTWAGVTNRELSHVDGSVKDARFVWIRFIVIDHKNNFYVLDDGLLRKITREGLVKTLVLTDISSKKHCTASSLAIDSKDNLYLRVNSGIRKIDSASQLNANDDIKLDCIRTLSNKEDKEILNVMTADKDNNLYGINGREALSKVSLMGEVSVIMEQADEFNLSNKPKSKH